MSLLIKRVNRREILEGAVSSGQWNTFCSAPKRIRSSRLSNVAEVPRADAAEAFVGRETQQPDRAGLREHLARNDAAGFPVGDVGCDFLGREIAGQLSERAVVSVVVQPLHRRSVSVCGVGDDACPAQ
jgi:hypothetical protein